MVMREGGLVVVVSKIKAYLDEVLLRDKVTKMAGFIDNVIACSTVAITAQL
uniref:Uncharacterized protein n=1 Tax=Hyaloperonospora arabidopsidis (strain Emoy2) TaxID=559515 RepID=M4C2S1_HYAAE